MKIAKLILHYNTPELTKKLQDSCPGSMIIDNGSSIPYPGAKLRFENNLGFTKGWASAVSYFLEEYDAIWFMNSDIELPVDTEKRLAAALEADPRLGNISPACNSPHDVMHSKGSKIRIVPFVEFIAPLIRTSLIKKIGFFDENFTKGWGIDYDYGWRTRRAGYKLGVFDSCIIRHLEHQTINLGDHEKYMHEAAEEMHHFMILKYGPDWYNKIMSMISLTMVVCNEGTRLEAMLDATIPHVDDVAIVVQESQDNTLEIARRKADTVIPTSCCGYCEKDRGLASRGALFDWQLCLDADERLTPEFVAEMRDLTSKTPKGYRLQRRLFEDGKKTFEGDHHYRFYHKNHVTFLDELHTEPQAADWSKVPTLPYIAIDHSKTLAEMIEDESRYDKVIETKYKGHSLYAAKKALNIHINK